MALKSVRIDLDDAARAWLRMRAAEQDKTYGQVITELIAEETPRFKKEAKRAKPRE